MSGFPKFDSNYFFVDVHEGRHPHHRLVTFNCDNTAIGTSNETLWPEGGIATYPTAATVLTISSDSSNDFSAGIGVQTVRISGLDSDFNEINEVVTMNGLAGVTSTNSYERINSMVALTAGSAAENQGLIFAGIGSLTLGKPATVFNIIETGVNLSHPGIYIVPAKHNAYLVGGLIGGEATKTGTVSVFVRFSGGLFVNAAEFTVENATISLAGIVPPRKLTGKTDIQIRGRFKSGSGLMAGFFTILLQSKP